FSVRAVADARSAIAAVTTFKPDVIVSDIEMPGMTGLEFTQAVRELHPDTSVVLMTAYATVDNVIEALRLGAADLMQKPVGIDALLGKVRELMVVPPGQSVLAVGAHPDDVEIGVGGILAAHRAQGDTVTILTLSSGAVGGDEVQREEESRAAAQLLGADIVFARLADTRLAQEPGLVSAIEGAVRDVQPDIVYTHGSADLHQDHAAAHHATMVACRRIARVYGYQSPSSTVAFAPKRFIPIDAHLETKLAAIACYSSQTEVRDYLADDLLTATARYWGRFTNVRYAEPLEVIAERGDLPSVSTAFAGTAQPGTALGATAETAATDAAIMEAARES
ncbi:MAG: PIG-L family deacetylase, partial [Ilumatobacteraceae bacterium]